MRCGSKRSKSERGVQSVLEWFGHVSRVHEERLTKKLCVRSGWNKEGRMRYLRGIWE